MQTNTQGKVLVGGAPDGDRPLGLRHDNGARRTAVVTASPTAAAVGVEQATATAIAAAASEDRGAAVT